MPARAEKLLIAHFGELWLRGRNRRFYIKALKGNITRQLRCESFTLEDDYDRLVITPGKGSTTGSIAAKISKVFGISAYETAYTAKPTLRSITATAMRLIKEEKLSGVKINSHRSYKGFRFNSIDIIRSVAKAAQEAGADPRLKEFKSQIYISVKKDVAFVFSDRKRGAGGLPVGTSGRCVVLLSGGIDSPVAAWYAMKRGLEPIYVHVHGFPSNGEAESSKIRDIIGILSQYCPNPTTYYVPSHVFQMSAIKSGRYELIMMKGFMLKLAESVARKQGAGAIVTGESLGQVASQTLSNITSEESGIAIPVLRPLIGLDKAEITQIAKSIGTYGESIKPYRDVCSINAKNPATRSDLNTYKRIAKEIKLGSVAARSLKMGSIVQTDGHSGTCSPK
jgi:thiamine biosynthesis protein ThiI